MNCKTFSLNLFQGLGILILAFVYSIGNAQGNSDSVHHIINEDLKTDRPERMQTPQEMVDAFLRKEKNRPSDSSMLNASFTDPRLDSVKLEAWNSYYYYMNFGYKHRRNVFYWQLVSSKIIFFVVIGLVSIGIYFAWLQFYHTIKLSKESGDVEKMLSTELTASFKEIKIVSPVLGVIILIISFLFFYLYLRYVYPISELF
jgi:hypothetical protein